MKKLLCLFLVFCLLSAFAACGREPEILTPDMPASSEPVEETKVDIVPLLCKEEKWQIVEDCPDSEDRFITTYTFHSSSFEYAYGYYFSDVIGYGESIYESDEDIITLHFLLEGTTEPTMVSYKAVPSEKGFTLTQVGDTGLFYYHKDGTILNMEPFNEEYIP